ncbi:YjjG family noncanonical pyrimidine nucleotidase [Bacteroides sp. 519]|uniref:YjjG family noncanonical pyrimidine nucleotidase n=1 Tax=Bacteroides sp. 519 TaxID=2302937 RepID=UPI0013D7B08B|nr:YjjG family noncanonical pyrimidine nucleotidase [Bacteroides sp. 519]NDV59301.1 noncanonical pyrimidine nucleotidase, YjjG family [Bacteroides sp. 519]
MRYKNIFFDLDDTLWAFSENSRDSFEEMYNKYNFDRYFDSFAHYYSLYEVRNLELWELYGHNEITKEQLNQMRFSHPLQQVGVNNPLLVKTFMDNYFAVVPTKEKLMPNTKEVLEYLNPKYNLYILSNGFRELQSLKMQSSGIGGYFKKIILSEDIGIMKPYPEIFHFALSATQSELRDSIMIGDNYVNDVQGAKGVGMDNVYYNIENRTGIPHDTTVIYDLKELKEIL